MAGGSCTFPVLFRISIDQIGLPHHVLLRDSILVMCTVCLAISGAWAHVESPSTPARNQAQLRTAPTAASTRPGSYLRAPQTPKEKVAARRKFLIKAPRILRSRYLPAAQSRIVFRPCAIIPAHPVPAAPDTADRLRQ